MGASSVVSPCSTARGRPGVGSRSGRSGRLVPTIAIVTLLGGFGLQAGSAAYAGNVKFVVQVDPVSTPEGGSATVSVKLSANPSGTVTASAIFQGSADPDLTVTSGSSLTFTTGDWNTWHPVTVAAAEDPDTTNGSRLLRLHKTSGSDAVPDKDVTANEADDDVSLTLAIAPTGYGTTTPSGTVIVDKGSGMPLTISTTATTSNTRTLTNTRVTVGNNAPTIQPFGPTATVTLPDADDLYRVKVEVQDDINTWSDPAEVMVQLRRGNPAVVGTPEVFRNDYGIVVLFNTNRPCIAELHTQDEVHIKTLPAGSNPQTSFALAFIRPEVAPNELLNMYIHLTDESGATADYTGVTATVAGGSSTYYISPGGTDAVGGGGQGNPWKTLQYAGDRSLPGDTIFLESGTYAEAATLTHGGYSDSARITIQKSPNAILTPPVLNGGRRIPVLIHLINAPYVTVRQLTYVYFKAAGIYAYQSPHVRVEDCISFNGKGWVGGVHVLTELSPYGLIQRNLAVGGDYGFVIGGYQDQSSPNTTVKYNTVSQTVYSGVEWRYSAAGSVQTNNSLAYNGNDNWTVLETSATSDLATFTSDYNNMGKDVRSWFAAVGLDQDPEVADIWERIQCEYFPPFPYGTAFTTSGKHLVSGAWFYDGIWHPYTYWTLGGERGLRNQRGFEVHSIFKDPLYVDPNQPMASWDWRLKSNSPNIGRGEGGTNIGALGVQP